MRTRFRDHVLRVVGCLSVATGMAGILLPLLPTTCFLLLGAACFARSSPRLHRWLTEHPVLGAYLRAVRDGEGMPRRVRTGTLAALWLSLTASAASLGSHGWAWLGLAAVGVVVTALILRLPVEARSKGEPVLGVLP
jgi:hypothetical protein